MSEQPWSRNEGKFDRPSSSLPKTDARVSVEVVGDSPLACAVRDELGRRGLHEIEPISIDEQETGSSSIEEVEQLQGEEVVATAAPMGRLSPAFLKGAVAEAERLIDERRDIALQLKAVRDALKDRGVNMKAFNELLRRREMDARLRDDFDEALAIYENVAGLSRGTIEGGTLKALAAPDPPPKSARSKALTEALVWAGVNGGGH